MPKAANPIASTAPKMAKLICIGLVCGFCPVVPLPVVAGVGVAVGDDGAGVVVGVAAGVGDGLAV